MDSRVAPAFGARQRLAIVACFATMFMLGMAISMLGPSLPALAARTGITLSQAGIFFSLFAGGSVLATLLLARYNDRPARHALLIGGSLVMGASFWLVATSRTFAQAGAAVALCGLSMSTVGTAPNAIITDLYRSRAGQALNALHVSVGVGSFAGPLLIGAAIRLGNDYRVAYRVAAAAILLVCILWIASRPPRPQRAVASERSGWRFLLSTLILVFALAMLYTGTEQVIGGWLFTYAQDATAMQAATASLLVALFWLAILLGRLAAVRILHRLTNLALLRACVLIGAAGVGVLLLGGSMPALLWTGVLLVGLAFGPVFPTTLALAGELAPGHAGAAGSLVVASGSVGAMILPWLAGALMPTIGIGGSIAAALLPLAGMLACLQGIKRRG
jgi:MFS transporter, FHS family, L-fucose permease